MGHTRYDESQIELAAKRYRRLSRAQQWRIADEIVATRSHELTHAYTGVVRIGIGLRRRRNDDGEACIERRSEVCVLFMVERKWRTLAPRRGKIPEFLLAFTATGKKGDPVLVAVPTDVDPMRTIERFRPELQVKSRVPGNTQHYGSGSVCGVVLQSASPLVRFGICCRHVLSYGPYARFNWRIVTAPGITDGVVTDVRGPSTGPRVMDAQLFLIAPGDSMAPFPRYAGYAQGASEARGTFILDAPSLPQNARRVVSRGVWQAPITPNPSSAKWMLAGELIEADVIGAATQPGDSGSPLYTGSAAQKLIGMHIGSIEKKNGCTSICVPAWRLLKPSNYDGAASNVVWRLL